MLKRVIVFIWLSFQIACAISKSSDCVPLVRTEDFYWRGNYIATMSVAQFRGYKNACTTRHFEERKTKSRWGIVLPLVNPITYSIMWMNENY